MKINNSESVIMEALWEESPQAAEDIARTVGPRQGWTEATVKTLINRLLTKNAISAEKDGRRYLYRPLVDRADYVTSESEGLLSRLFEGRLAPLVSHFSEQQKLTPEDVAELKALIAELDNDR
jgi:BlaI family transcriptional regulator, penicillinase repressor